MSSWKLPPLFLKIAIFIMQNNNVFSWITSSFSMQPLNNVIFYYASLEWCLLLLCKIFMCLVEYKYHFIIYVLLMHDMLLCVVTMICMMHPYLRVIKIRLVAFEINFYVYDFMKVAFYFKTGGSNIAFLFGLGFWGSESVL